MPTVLSGGDADFIVWNRKRLVVIKSESDVAPPAVQEADFCQVLKKLGFIISETRSDFPNRLARFVYASKPEQFAIGQMCCCHSGIDRCDCQLRL